MVPAFLNLLTDWWQKVKKTFVLITRTINDAWAQELSCILQPLGRLKLVPYEDFQLKKLSPSCELVIIDSSAVKSVVMLIADLLQSDPQCRVIAMTASPTWQRARAAFEAGALDYLSKNLRPEELLECVRAVLEKPRPAKARTGVSTL